MTAHDAVPAPDLPITGRCSCEQVRFEVSEPLVGAVGCYCRRCQRRTGTAYSATALTRQGTFRITAGEDLVVSYPAENGWVKSFCKICGGHVYCNAPDDETKIAIRLGAVDGEPGVRIAGYQFTDYASVWSPPPDDDLPHFPERADWSKLGIGSRP